MEYRVYGCVRPRGSAQKWKRVTVTVEATSPESAMVYAQRRIRTDWQFYADRAIKVAVRRSKDQVQADRAALLESIGTSWVRPPEGARSTDIDALVASGDLESEVRREYDPQHGNGENLFGGAGVVRRMRRYVRRAA